MTSSTKKKARRSQIGPMERARRQANYIRLLAFLVAATILMAGLKLELYPQLYMLGVAGLLVYPLIAQGLLFLERGSPWRAGSAVDDPGALLGHGRALLRDAVVRNPALPVDAAQRSRLLKFFLLHAYFRVEPKTVKKPLISAKVSNLILC